jgi:hypothetical protein
MPQKISGFSSIRRVSVVAVYSDLCKLSTFGQLVSFFFVMSMENWPTTRHIFYLSECVAKGVGRDSRHAGYVVIHMFCCVWSPSSSMNKAYIVLIVRKRNNRKHKKTENNIKNNKIFFSKRTIRRIRHVLRLFPSQLQPWPIYGQPNDYFQNLWVIRKKLKKNIDFLSKNGVDKKSLEFVLMSLHKTHHSITFVIISFFFFYKYDG